MAFALALDDSPVLQMSAYAVSPDKQEDVSRFAKPLPVALANSLRAFANGLGPFDADTIGAVMKALSKTTVTEPSETETRITVPLKDAESHLFRAFNLFLDSQGPTAGEAPTTP